MLGGLLHLLTTVSTLLFGGHGLHKQNISVQPSKSISRQEKGGYGQNNKARTLAQQLKIGSGGRGGEPKGFSSRGAGKSKKNKDEIAPRSPGNAGSTFHAPSSSPSQAFSRSLTNEERGPIPIDLQPDLQTNKPTDEQTAPQITHSSPIPVGNLEKASTLMQGNELRGTSVNEPAASIHTSFKEVSISAAKPGKAAFINQKQSKLNVPASLRQLGQALNQLGDAQQQPAVQAQTQQPQQNQTQQPGQGGLVNVPLPSLLILEDLPPNVSDVELAKITPLPPDAADVELAKMTPPLPLPQEDLNLPPPLEEAQGNLQQLEQETLNVPLPKPIVQAEPEQESTLKNAVINVKAKLKPLPAKVPNKPEVTEVQNAMARLKHISLLPEKQKKINPHLAQIQKGMELRKTARGKELNEEAKKIEQELKRKSSSGLSFDERIAKMREDKAIEEKKILEKKAKEFRKAFDNAFKAKKELNEVKVGKYPNKGNLLDDIKNKTTKENLRRVPSSERKQGTNQPLNQINEGKNPPEATTITSNLKSTPNRKFLPPEVKDKKESIWKKETHMKILARRAAIRGEEKNETNKDTVASTPSSKKIGKEERTEAIEEVTPQPTAKTKPKPLPQAQGQTGKSMEEVLRERMKNIPVTEQKLLPKGSSDKEKDDDEWK